MLKPFYLIMEIVHVPLKKSLIQNIIKLKAFKQFVQNILSKFEKLHSSVSLYFIVILLRVSCVPLNDCFLSGKAYGLTGF